MTLQPPPPNMSNNKADTNHASVGLPLRQNKVVLVVDLVESVRLMATNEAGAIEQWRKFLKYAESDVLSPRSGRMVKSLGDGFLAEFDSASDAVPAALALHQYLRQNNDRLPQEEQFHLRAGIHATYFYQDTNDVFGNGVNLAARITSLANPGETVVTAPVRDGMVDGVDGWARVTSNIGRSRCAPGGSGRSIPAVGWSRNRLPPGRRKTCAPPSP